MTAALTVSTVPPVQANHMLVVTLSDDDRKALHTHPTFGPLAAYWHTDRTLYLLAGREHWLYPFTCSADWPWESVTPGQMVPGSLEVRPSASRELLTYREHARILWNVRYLTPDEEVENGVLEDMDAAWNRLTPDERAASDAWLRRDEFLWLRWLDADTSARGLHDVAARARRQIVDIASTDSVKTNGWPAHVKGGRHTLAELHDMIVRHALEP